MQEDQSLITVGNCVDHAMQVAGFRWVREYAPGTEQADMLATAARTMEVIVSHRRGGVLHVTVTIYGKYKHNDASDHFKFLKRSASAGYVLKASTIPKV